MQVNLLSGKAFGLFPKQIALGILKFGFPFAGFSRSLAGETPTLQESPLAGGTPTLQESGIFERRWNSIKFMPFLFCL
jgi:hypothetical protein